MFPVRTSKKRHLSLTTSLAKMIVIVTMMRKGMLILLPKISSLPLQLNKNHSWKLKHNLNLNMNEKFQTTAWKFRQHVMRKKLRNVDFVGKKVQCPFNWIKNHSWNPIWVYLLNFFGIFQNKNWMVQSTEALLASCLANKIDAKAWTWKVSFLFWLKRHPVRNR